MQALVLVALNLVMSVVYVLLGRVVVHRRPDGAGRMAGTAFALWWFGLGALTAATVVNFLVATLWNWSLAAYMAYLHVVLLTLLAALAGLMYYMIYLFTGRRGAWLPIVAAYGVYYLAIVAYLAVAQPVALRSATLGSTVKFANDLQDHWSTLVLGMGLIVPPLIAALAYISLFFQVDERSQRFRIAAIGGAFVLWFGITLGVGQLTEWGSSDAWRIGSAMVALAASGLVFVAFQPPAWLQRRFGLAGYGEHA